MTHINSLENVAVILKNLHLESMLQYQHYTYGNTFCHVINAAGINHKYLTEDSRRKKETYKKVVIPGACMENY